MTETRRPRGGPATFSREETYREEILAWYSENGRDFPWRSTGDPYRILVAEILLQRTRAISVAPIYERFLYRWPRIDTLAGATEQEISALIAPLGLAKRAPLICDLAQELVRLGKVPASLEQLLALPGVGPYSARSTLISAFGEDLPLVDWVIGRVLNRYWGLPGELPPKVDPLVWEVAEQLAGYGKTRDLWLGTLDLANQLCQPQPKCGHCPLSGECVEGKRRLRA